MRLRHRFLGLIFLGALCTHTWAQIDRDATAETLFLHDKLTEAAINSPGKNILFGQQGAFTAGRGWRISGGAQALPATDLKKAVGVDPAMMGYDFNEIGNWNYELIVDQIKKLHKKGGVITLSWHMKPIVNDGRGEHNAWDVTAKDVGKILTQEQYKNAYLAELDRLAKFAGDVLPAPIIYRPFHEHNGNWFWWGQKHCSKDEYVKLWRLTVDYLKSKGVHNFLYAYSPDAVTNKYEERYPGDNYVDILGVDMYFRNAVADRAIHGMFPQAEWKNDIFRLLEMADRRNKIPAITEFGNEGVWYDNFWTDYFAWPIVKKGMEDWGRRSGKPVPKIGMAYIMIWRNDSQSPSHFYGPAPGHSDVNNFKLMMSAGSFQFLPEKRR